MCSEGDRAWRESQNASAFVTAQLQIPPEAVVAAVKLHNDLFGKHAEDYYSALTELSKEEAVRMEAARYFAFFPVDTDHECECGCGGGRGDLLRMAAGVNPLKQQFRSQVFLMEDWVAGNSTKDSTIRRLIRLVCGKGTCTPDVVQQVRTYMPSSFPQGAIRPCPYAGVSPHPWGHHQAAARQLHLLTYFLSRSSSNMDPRHVKQTST